MIKDFKTISQQVEILKNKGLIIDDIEKAEMILLKENYFFLNGYRHLFMNSSSDRTFVTGATFDELYSLFLFDRYSRNIFFKNLLIVENRLKSIISYQLSKRYGYKDWYDWSIANWGTKWNATTISVDDDTEAIEFDTAWSMPEPVFKAIAKHTPLRVLYADEDLGNNCGMEDYYVNENGEVEIGVVLEGSPELACDCWGYGCVDVYDRETGEQVDEDDTRFIEANKNYSAVQEEINLLMNTETIDKDFKEV